MKYFIEGRKSEGRNKHYYEMFRRKTEGRNEHHYEIFRRKEGRMKEGMSIIMKYLEGSKEGKMKEGRKGW